MANMSLSDIMDVEWLSAISKDSLKKSTKEKESATINNIEYMVFI